MFGLTIDGNFIYPYKDFTFPNSGIVIEYESMTHSFINYFSLDVDEVERTLE